MSCSRGCWALGMAFGAPARTVLHTLGGPDVFTCWCFCHRPGEDAGGRARQWNGQGRCSEGCTFILAPWAAVGGVLIRATWQKFYLQNKTKPSSLSLLGE